MHLQIIQTAKSTAGEQEDIIQYQTTSNDAATTQQGSSTVQYALPNKKTAKSNPGVSIYISKPNVFGFNYVYYQQLMHL